MLLSLSRRPLAAAAVIALAVVGASGAGGPLGAVLLGLVGGSIATLLTWRTYFFPEAVIVREPSSGDREQWANALLGALAEPLLLIEGGRVVVANAAAKQLLGRWIEGQDVRLALRHPGTLELLSRPAAPDGEVEQMEIVGIGQAERRWLVRIAALEDARLVHLVDRSEAIAAEKMRVDFVANASHELRTPLATLLGFIETLQDDSVGGDDEVRSRFLGLMFGEGKRMQTLIEDLMSLSRIEAERYNPPRDTVDLVQIVEEVRAGCAQLFLERSNVLVVENDARSTIVPGDRGQLLQLVRNLIVNALKYGRAQSQVTVRFEDAGPSQLRFAVVDRGEGIAVEHLPRLTERFYRVDAGRSRAVGGTGLGLAIVKHIVSRHRGRLDISSRVGEGTCVTIWLPRETEALS
ncbi:MAG TPA: ATP-binding protein [Allosphingosinicella sp.]|nr:ATP-binding protein [Allosphingosinicella sp.]